MIRIFNVPSVRLVFLVHLLLWWNTAVNDLDAAAISREAENRAIAATVRIYTKDFSWQSWQDTMFSGSGFFVAPNLIATNFHVIADKDSSRVVPYIAYRHSTKDRFRTVKPARVFDIKRDLAVLEVSRSRVKQLLLGGSETVERLDIVYVVGFAKALDCGITSGEINNPKERLAGVEYIRFDAAVSRGNSGGPVLNLHGDVIGVATAVYKSRIQIEQKDIGVSVPQNLNFAIPSNYLRSLLYRHGVPVPPKPKRKPVNRNTGRKNEERAKADRAKAEARKVEAEAKIAEAEAEKAQAEAKKADAEARKSEAERDKAEAEKTKAESKIAEAQRTETEETDPNTGEAEIPIPDARITDRLQAATVHIYGTDRNGNEGRLGSGFFVREDQVATDFHVVVGSTLKGVKPISRTSQSPDVHLPAELLKTKNARHLAILQVNAADVQPLLIGRSERVRVGDSISVLNNPLNPDSLFTGGTISYITEKDGLQYFQFDAPVSPGSSGGPIVNSKGEVIAVSALKVPEFAGTLKFAIPSNYLAELLDGEGDPQATEPPVSQEKSEDDPEVSSSTPYDPEFLLNRAIGLYEQTHYKDAIERLENLMNRINDPKTRAVGHLYLAFSKWGLDDTESSVRAELREALRYDPGVNLPSGVGQNHPVFKPMLENARQEFTGTLTISVSPPETEILVHGGTVQPKLPDDRTKPIRLFKGNYAVEGKSGHSAKVVQVQIEPGRHKDQHLPMPPMPQIAAPPSPSHEFELTLDIFSVEQPKAVIVRFSKYDPSGNQIGSEEKKEMQLREHKPESSIWVYYVKLPSADQGGRIVYRIEADGKVIRDEPIQVQILEPPNSAFFDVQDTIPVKARVVSAVAIRDVRVYYDAPGKLSKNSPAKLLKRESDSNTYTGEIPAERNRTDGDTWFFVAAAPEKGIQSRSPTRSARAKTDQSEDITITVLEPLVPVPTDKSINVKAEVESSAPLNDIRVHYDFPRSQLSKESQYKMLKYMPSGTYVGEIPREYNRGKDYIWYFFAVTTANGMVVESEDRMVEVKKKPTTPIRQGVWASHSWSNVVSDERFYSGWERGDVLSLAFLREGKGVDTFGSQLDYTYENPDYITATVQWGPSTRDSAVVFAFLAGAAGHRASDPSLSRVRQSRQITPILGGSMKFYPLDQVALDLSGTMKLRSENSAADREPNFVDDYLHHYGVGIRLYISPSLNLKAGYGRWRFGGYENASVQVGLGATF